MVSLVLIPFGFTGQIAVMTDGSWSVGTRLTQGGQPLSYTLGADMLRRLLLSAPLLTAILLWATLNPEGLRALVGEIKD